MIHQQSDVFGFGQRPHIIVEQIGHHLLTQHLHRFVYAVVVHLDAIGHQLLDAVPIGCLIQRLGSAAGGAKHCIVFVKPGQNGGRHLLGLLVH